MRLMIPFLAILLHHCGENKTKNIKYVVVDSASESDATPTDSGADGDSDEGEVSLADLQTGYGMKNFSQINETMSVLTGVNPLTPAVLAIYTEVRTSLPSNNDIRSFLASQQSGISKLATEYCDAMMINATLRTAVVPSLNVTALPAAAWSTAARDAVINDFYKAFWPEGTENRPEESQVKGEVSLLIDQLLSSTLPATTASTLNIGKGVCVVFLSSSPVLIF